MIHTVLLDLDGVIRHFDPSDVSAIELAHGLTPGAVADAAFSSPLLEQVTTGQITRREWIAEVGSLLGSKAAADEWGRIEASVDPEMIELVEVIRGLGHTTAILTNGTDTIPEELLQLGVTGHFDHVFNSAEIGFSKPDVRAFEHVLFEIGISGSEVFFTDDSASKLAGADALGMATHLFRGVPGLRAALRDHGVSV